MTVSVGLDFGHSQCRVAYDANGQPVALARATRLSQVRTNYQGARKVPKVDDQVGSGTRAIADNFKSSLGSQDMIKFGKSLISPTELAKTVINAVREAAREAVREAVREDSKADLQRAMVVVPANASEPQRAAIRDAVRSAGFLETRLISETLAAAITAHKARGDDGWYLVYHLGAGPFEASIVRAEGQRYQLASTVGSGEVCGYGFDRLIRDHMVQQAGGNGSLPADPLAQWRTLQQAEAAKIALFRGDGVTFALSGKDRKSSVERTLTRAAFEAWIRPAVDLTLRLAQQVVAEANVSRSHLEAVLMIGGTTMIPLVHRLCGETFEQEPVLLDAYAVARGAALQAHATADADWVSVPVKPPATPAAVSRVPAKPPVRRDARTPRRRRY